MEFDNSERYYGVGPTGVGTDHDVLVVSESYDDTLSDGTLWICLTCGLTTMDDRYLRLNECDRENNPIPQTLAERREDRDE